ncbi:MAG: hypothetical protein AAFU41_03080 [Pseudomonadota bacterium]
MKQILLSTAMLIATAGAASADWRSERTSVGPNGVTSNATTSVTRDGNTRTTVTEVLRDNGTGYTREVIQTWDPETKSWTRTVVGKTAGGNTWINNGSGSCSGGACNSQSVFSGSGGRVIESQSSSTINRDGGQRKWSWNSNAGNSGEGQRIWQRLR